MNSIRLRSFSALKYRDPVPFLVKLRQLEVRMLEADLPDHVRALRTNKLKKWRELREAALFCYFIGQRGKTPVYLAEGESQDFDFVAVCQGSETIEYTPVQLKEVVPTNTNPDAALEPVLASLIKYTDSTDLAVVIHLNQVTHFNPKDVLIPKLTIGSLWMFGAISEDQEHWGLWGDFLQSCVGTRHEYPAA
jgi:hypothetical protein